MCIRDRNIYIVEDDKNIAEIEEFALKNAGYEVCTFANAKDFEKRIQYQYPDLIIMDIMLPDRDGLSLLKDIRSHSETASIPVIMVTVSYTHLDVYKRHLQYRYHVFRQVCLIHG